MVQRAIIIARTHREDWTVRASDSNDNHKDITDCITGIIFLGTPFRGSDSQSYARTIGTILSVLGKANAKIYDVIAPNSQALKDQLNDFVRIVNRQSMPIFCFFEQHKANLSRILGTSLAHYVSIRPLLLINVSPVVWHLQVKKKSETSRKLL